MSHSSDTRRNPALDILRCLAIVLVATQHAWSMLGLDEPICGLLADRYRALVDCGVPLFVAISGALLLAEEPQAVGTFLRRRFGRVLIPFAIWATAIYVLSICLGQYADITTATDGIRLYLPYLLYNRINPSHWFVWMILALYLVTPVLQRMLRADDSRRVVQYLLGVMMLTLVASWLLPEAFILRYSSPLLIYLFVYLAGYYIATWLNRYSFYFGLVAILTIGMSLMPGAPVWLLTRLTALAIFGMLVPLRDCSLRQATKNIAAGLSRYSYTIYLIHIPIIRALILVLRPEATAYMPILLSLAALSLSACGCYLLDRMLPRAASRALGLV